MTLARKIVLAAVLGAVVVLGGCVVRDNSQGEPSITVETPQVSLPDVTLRTANSEQIADELRYIDHTICREGCVVFWRHAVNDNGIFVRMADEPWQSRPWPFGGMPVWSPDGRKIAFAALLDGEGRVHYQGIFVMNPDGTELIQLSSGEDSGSTWSPDGTRIVFVSRQNGNRDIYVVNADGSGQPTNLTNSSADEESVAWSPVGDRIVFVSKGSITVMDADGLGRTRLAKGRDPAWSPDGTRIAFSQMGARVSDIYVMNADGSGQPSNLTNSPRSESQPSWSRDGSRIAYVTHRQVANFGIHVMNADGSGIISLSPDPSEDSSPVWGP